MRLHGSSYQGGHSSQMTGAVRSDCRREGEAIMPPISWLTLCGDCSMEMVGPAAVWDYGMMPKSFEQMAS
jgi:hypothetical protein